MNKKIISLESSLYNFLINSLWVAKFEFCKNNSSLFNSSKYQFKPNDEKFSRFMIPMLIGSFFKFHALSSKFGYYFYDCTYEVYEKSFDTRVKGFIKKNAPDAKMIDFLNDELNKFSSSQEETRTLKFSISLMNNYLKKEKKNLLSFEKLRKQKYIKDSFVKIDEETISINYSKYIGDGGIGILSSKREKIKFLKSSINKEEASQDQLRKIKWSGKVSQLGFIFSELAQKGYIDAPKNSRGDINNTEFARQLLEIIKIKSTPGSLSKYLNIDDDKYKEVERSFQKKNIIYLIQIKYSNSF